MLRSVWGAGLLGGVVLLALAAGVLTQLPYWNWWGFSSSFVFMQMADLVVGGCLAGLVIARIVGPGAGGV